MAFVTTQTANLNYIQTAYDLMARAALRPELFFDQLADVFLVHFTHDRDHHSILDLHGHADIE